VSVRDFLHTERQPTDIYDLLGRPRFDPDREALASLIRSAYGELLPLQNHRDPKMARRAMQLQLELGRAQDVLSHDGKLKGHHRQILDALRTAYLAARGEAQEDWVLGRLKFWLRGVGSVHPACLNVVARLVRDGTQPALEAELEKTLGLSAAEDAAPKCPAGEKLKAPGPPPRGRPSVFRAGLEPVSPPGKGALPAGQAGPPPLPSSAAAAPPRPGEPAIEVLGTSALPEALIVGELPAARECPNGGAGLRAGVAEGGKAEDARRTYPGRILRHIGRVLRRVPARIFGGVRVADGVLRSVAGEENAILHGFLRVMALVAVGAAAVFAAPPLAAGLAKLASGLVGSGETSPDAAATRPPGAAAQNGVTNSLGMRLVLIPAGDFSMGSEDDDPAAFRDERPRHPVEITRPFYLAVHELTVGQFRRFADTSGYRTDAERRERQRTWRNPGFEQTGDHPAAYLSWNDALAFCGWLSEKEGRQYRLPTEAEWEYACRAQGTSPAGPGGEPAEVSDLAWWQSNAENKTHPVGAKHANAWGLHDMLGNVSEWCQDWYDEEFYAQREEKDPHGPASGRGRVLRGGSATSQREYVREAFRSSAAPEDCGLSGVRVALVPAEGNAEAAAMKPPEGKREKTNRRRAGRRKARPQSGP
jgi:sulfatase modifying factor 1